MSRTPSSPPVVILGAGLTGLSAAYHLQGVPRVLVERAGAVGGKARSERVRGHTFDITGHWLHLRDPRMQALVSQLFADDDGQGPGSTALERIDRVTRVFSHGALLAYPFQANLHGLPLEIVQECLVELVAARERAARGEGQAPATFEEFAVARFGKGIARHFFVPYNTKLWGMNPDQLTADWVSRFIPIPDAAQIIGGAIGLRQEGLGYNAHFLYPKTGGIDHLPKALRRAGVDGREDAELLLETALEELDVAGRRVKLTGEGDWRDYGALISSIPLPELIKRTPGAPAEVREAARRLRWVRWRYLNVGTRAPVPVDYHWVYVPELRYPFFRVGVFSNAVSSMAPRGRASLYVELNEREGPVDERAVAAALAEIGAVRRVEDIAFMDIREGEYAYVVFDDAYASSTKTIHDWLARVGVRSCGRYGAWIYNSMEDSMIQGLEAAGWAKDQVVAVAGGGG